MSSDDKIVMKKFKCPNCAQTAEVVGDTISIMCGCGYHMIEQKIIKL